MTVFTRRILPVLLGMLWSGTSYASEEFNIIAPEPGERVSQLRPVVAVNEIAGAENYLIEISLDPTFFDRNTLTYVSSNEGLLSAPVSGTMQRLRLAGLNQKYQRYEDRRLPWQWQVPHNLTAVLTAPYGKRILPCRDWLKHFSDLIVEGHEDPLRALNEYVSFTILNEGSGSGYYSAYETLARDMGVCGNTAELLAAFSATQGFATKILSLKAPDQGHVVTSTQRDDGQWVLLDGLYNIMVEGSADELISRVAADPDFLDIPAFDNVDVPYRHFFHSTHYAYQIETTSEGILYTDEVVQGGTVRYSELSFTCTPEMFSALEAQKITRISNTFLGRASYYSDGEWSPWAYSYFNFVPDISEEETVQDNIRNIWRQGLALPEQFLGGVIHPFSGGSAFGSASEEGYSVDYVAAVDGMGWLSRPWSEEETEKRVGYDLGEGNAVSAKAIFVGWIAPSATPARFRIEGSQDGQDWDIVSEAEVEYGETDANYRIDRVSFDQPRQYRFWSLVVDQGDISGPLGVESLSLIIPPDQTISGRVDF